MCKWLKTRAFCISLCPLCSRPSRYGPSPSINCSAVFVVRLWRKRRRSSQRGRQKRISGADCRLWHVHRPVPGIGGGSSFCSADGKNRTAAGRKSAYFQEIKEGQKAALFCFPTGMPRRHLRGDFWDRVGYQRRPLPCGKGLISVPAMEEKRTRRCCRWKSIHGPCLRQTILPCHCSHR